MYHVRMLERIRPAAHLTDCDEATMWSGPENFCRYLAVLTV